MLHGRQLGLVEEDEFLWLNRSHLNLLTSIETEISIQVFLTVPYRVSHSKIPDENYIRCAKL